MPIYVQISAHICLIMKTLVVYPLAKPKWSWWSGGGPKFINNLRPIFSITPHHKNKPKSSKKNPDQTSIRKYITKLVSRD